MRLGDLLEVTQQVKTEPSHPGVANMAGNPPGARQGRGETWRRGSGWGSVRSGGRLLAGVVKSDPLHTRGGGHGNPLQCSCLEGEIRKPSSAINAKK